MSELPPPSCPRCGQAAPRLIEELCPACLARNVRMGLDALMTPAAADELAPEIHGLEIREPLGAGGMGLVFRGVRESDGEPLAIKVLPRGLSCDPEWRERFQREAAALSALDHPNIVRILGSGETLDGRLYLAMELVEGCDLRRLLRTGKLEPARALDIAGKVAAALIHAHGRGIVHRDIKPGNILVGDGGVVKVADFGIARAISGDASSFTLTQTRETFGTPYYIAPEVAEDATAASPASDVYAVGVMLYEMLTGRVPMGKFTPASRGTGLDSQVDGLIASALADDPAVRTRHMADLLNSLRRSQRRLLQQDTKRRWRLRLGIAGALMVSAGIGVLITSRVMRRPVVYPFPDAATVTRNHPWENSLGMKFVPVAGTGVLFSIFETRRQDYQPYAVENSMMDHEDGLSSSPLKMHTIRDGREVFDDSTWQNPGFEQTETHPAVGMSMLNAFHFCRWLTTKERTIGRLRAGQRYRLPTPDEWDGAFAAGGLVEGNLAGREVLAGGWPEGVPHADSTDAFARTAPAGSFRANAVGLYDMEGNVMEACMDRLPADAQQERRNFFAILTVRGGSWRSAQPKALELHEKRIQLRPFLRRADAGFRIVLDLAKTQS